MEKATAAELTYPGVGSSRFASTAPMGFQILHNRVRLGTGIADYAKAKAALQKWAMVDFPWFKIVSPTTLPCEGMSVISLARFAGLKFLNACRVVYTIDDTEPLQRWGFAYGTLPDHAERGEERFLVELNPQDESVWYDIFSFSRPGPILYQLGTSLIKKLQKRFQMDSLQAMQRAMELPPL